MRSLGILLALVLALAASACGGSSQPAAEQAPQDAIVLAAAKTKDAGTYKADTTASSELAGQTFEMSGTGEFDGENQRGQMTMTTSIAGQDLDMEMVYALPAIYVRYPPGLLPGMPAGKPWVKLDLEKLGREAGLDLNQLMQVGQSDPSQGLQFLSGASDVQSVGQEDVRGVPTTHYKGTVDLQALAEKNPALKDSVDQLIQQSGVTEVPIEVWIDDEGFVRRMKQSLEGAAAGSGVKMDLTTTTELYDFGTDVNVEEPPADQVVDFSELMGQS
ncbi:MAG TPA: LppX_LprAFG lipoprotein [Gaiellaceae bacterium]|nr:LppX_LprAFG lipoprotein [Gaiellaceae bacterium]